MIVVAEIVENHHHNHQDSIADGENVKRSSSDIFGLNMDIFLFCHFEYMYVHLDIKL